MFAKFIIGNETGRLLNDGFICQDKKYIKIGITIVHIFRSDGQTLRFTASPENKSLTVFLKIYLPNRPDLESAIFELLCLISTFIAVSKYKISLKSLEVWTEYLAEDMAV